MPNAFVTLPLDANVDLQMKKTSANIARRCRRFPAPPSRLRRRHGDDASFFESRGIWKH